MPDGPRRIPTTREIALYLGLSQSTVSRGLNNHPGLAPSTCRTVQAAATRLGWRPHAMVSQLMAQVRQGRIRPQPVPLAVITRWPAAFGWRRVPDLVAMWDGACQRAAALGWRLVEAAWEPGVGGGAELSQQLDERGIRGLLLFPLPQRQGAGRLAMAWDRFVTVACDRSIRRPEVHRTSIAFHDNALLLFQRLRGLGRRRIGFISKPGQEARTNHAWISAWCFHQRDIPERERIPLLTSADHGAIDRWLRRHRPDAVVGSELYECDWIREAGLRVPQDTAFALINWTPAARGVAGIDGRTGLVGAMAIDLLVEQLHCNAFGIPTHPRIVEVPGRWISGASVRAGEP